jgi:8-oxo-dGTP pyrophosphatase MutT (NUDIX family)
MIKHCVGAVIYSSEGKIFLMTSPKWKGYIVPGGKIQENETEEQALIREIKEELGIEITNIKKVGEKVKPPSKDFKDETITIHFIDFFAKATSTEIKPNHEVLEYGWFEIDDALLLPLLDTTRNFVEQFKKYVNSGLIRFD